MNVTILGQWGAYPAAESANSSFLVEQDGFYLLVDCGSGVLSQIQKFIPLEQLDALILSHYHHDHIADIGPLQYGMLIQTQLGNRDSALRIYGHGQDKEKFDSLSFDSYTVGKEINETDERRIGPFQITFSKTVHPAYCLAMRISAGGHSLVYTADTEWSDELVTFAQNAELLISEASLYNEQYGKVKGHLTSGEAGDLAKKANVKRLVLTHLPHYGDHKTLIQQAKKRYSGEVLLAKEGLEIRI
jgi:ribonuclease BN (tRNA processing enzyme)